MPAPACRLRQRAASPQHQHQQSSAAHAGGTRHRLGTQRPPASIAGRRRPLTPAASVTPMPRQQLPEGKAGRDGHPSSNASNGWSPALCKRQSPASAADRRTPTPTVSITPKTTPATACHQSRRRTPWPLQAATTRKHQSRRARRRALPPCKTHTSRLLPTPAANATCPPTNGALEATPAAARWQRRQAPTRRQRQ